MEPAATCCRARFPPPETPLPASLAGASVDYLSWDSPGNQYTTAQEIDGETATIIASLCNVVLVLNNMSAFAEKSDDGVTWSDIDGSDLGPITDGYSIGVQYGPDQILGAIVVRLRFVSIDAGDSLQANQWVFKGPIEGF